MGTSAVETIKYQSKSIKSLKVKIKMLDEEVERLRDLRFNMETEIMSRDKLINEMRLKLPYTVPTSALAPVTEFKSEQLTMARQQLEGLQERLKLKEENLVKTLQQVDELRKENSLIKINHEEQVKVMQNKIEQAFINNRHVVVPVLTSPDNKQKENTERLMELEDLVKEQDSAISSLMEKI